MAVPEEGQFLPEWVGPVEDAMQPAHLEQSGDAARRMASSASASSAVRLARMEQAIDTGVRPGISVAQQLGPGRSETGAAVEVGHLAEIPGIVAASARSEPRANRSLISWIAPCRLAWRRTTLGVVRPPNASALRWALTR